jgi:hypothetical protein
MCLNGAAQRVGNICINIFASECGKQCIQCTLTTIGDAHFADNTMRKDGM